MNNQAALMEAIKLTDQILTVLDDQDFDRLAELEIQREPLIRQAFSASVEQIDRIKATHLQNLNQRVVEKLRVFKQSVLQQQKQIRKASKATKAYISHQESHLISRVSS